LLLLIFIGAWGNVVYHFKFAPSLTSATTPTPTALSGTPAATFVPTPAPSLSGTVEPVSDTDWSLLQPGLERRVIQI